MEARQSSNGPDGNRSRVSSPGVGAATHGGSARQRVLDQIEIWRKELINLARSNRLLYFRHTKSSTLEIVREPDQIAEVVARTLTRTGLAVLRAPGAPRHRTETMSTQLTRSRCSLARCPRCPRRTS